MREEAYDSQIFKIGKLVQTIAQNNTTLTSKGYGIIIQTMVGYTSYWAHISFCIRDPRISPVWGFFKYSISSPLF